MSDQGSEADPRSVGLCPYNRHTSAVRNGHSTTRSSMPNFKWEPLDFLEALDVVPVEEEYGISYQYLLSRGTLSLSLTIWPLTCDVELLLKSGEISEPLVRINLLDCPGARVVRDIEGTFIEFSAAKLFQGRYDYTDAPPYGFRLQVQPFIQVTTFSYPV